MLKLNKAELASLASVPASLRCASAAARRGDIVAVFGETSKARAATVSAVVSVLFRSAQRQAPKGESIPQPATADWDGTILPALAQLFPASTFPEKLSVARANANEDAGCNFVRTLAQSLRNRISKANGPATGGKAGGNEREEQITVRLTAADLAALQRDGSTVITVSAKRRVRIVAA